MEEIEDEARYLDDFGDEELDYPEDPNDAARYSTAINDIVEAFHEGSWD